MSLLKNTLSVYPKCNTKTSLLRLNCLWFFPCQRTGAKVVAKDRCIIKTIFNCRINLHRFHFITCKLNFSPTLAIENILLLSSLKVKKNSHFKYKLFYYAVKCKFSYILDCSLMNFAILETFFVKLSRFKYRL